MPTKPKQPQIKMQPIPPYGEHMTLKEFITCCEAGAFIDLDGFGEYATHSQLTDKVAKPSDIVAGKIDLSWSHVVWFNK